MDLKTVYNIFKDCRNLYKRFYDSELNEDDIENFRKCVKKISNKYGDNAFVRDLLMAVINEVDRIEKEKRKEGK